MGAEVTVRFHPKRAPCTLALVPGETVEALLVRLGEPVDGVLVFDGDRPMPLPEPVTAGEVLVVRAASGG